MRTYSLKDDLDFLCEAEKQYAKEYCEEIKKLGYFLSTGVACNPVVGIAARIFGLDAPPKDLQARIESLLPKMFVYKGQEIPVDLRIVGKVVPAKQ